MYSRLFDTAGEEITPSPTLFFASGLYSFGFASNTYTSPSSLTA